MAPWLPARSGRAPLNTPGPSRRKTKKFASPNIQDDILSIIILDSKRCTCIQHLYAVYKPKPHTVATCTRYVWVFTSQVTKTVPAVCVSSQHWNKSWRYANSNEMSQRLEHTAPSSHSYINCLCWGFLLFNNELLMVVSNWCLEWQLLAMLCWHRAMIELPYLHEGVTAWKRFPHYRPFMRVNHQHYGDVIMGTIASQITSLTIVYSTVYSCADQRKHQSSASLAFVWGIHRDRWIPRTNGQ